MWSMADSKSVTRTTVYGWRLNDAISAAGWAKEPARVMIDSMFIAIGCRECPKRVEFQSVSVKIIVWGAGLRPLRAEIKASVTIDMGQLHYFQ